MTDHAVAERHPVAGTEAALRAHLGGDLIHRRGDGGHLVHAQQVLDDEEPLSVEVVLLPFGHHDRHASPQRITTVRFISLPVIATGCASI